MEFLAPKNSAKPEFPAPLQNVAPQRFVKDLAEFRRAEIQEFSGPGNFVQGGGISGPKSKFPAFLKTLLWVILSIFIVVPFPTSLHHQSCAIPGETLQCLAQD
jgi:hypothetical protein